MKFLVEHDEKHIYAIDTKTNFMDYANMLIFWYFSQKPISRF